MTEKDEISIQRILLGNLQQAQCSFDEYGNYVYSQAVADYFLKEYDDYTEKIWKNKNESLSKGTGQG
jgi:hypothetical protein